jgi:hypothetical protein
LVELTWLGAVGGHHSNLISFAFAKEAIGQRFVRRRLWYVPISIVSDWSATRTLARHAILNTETLSHFKFSDISEIAPALKSNPRNCAFYGKGAALSTMFSSRRSYAKIREYLLVYAA